jgi:glycosyltransferase involved in cell wall biosynthesis
MSSGVPVIGTTAEGLPELIRPEETGYLLPVGDVEGMARRAIEILSDSKKHAAMSAESRRIAEEKYEASRIVPMYENFYAETLGLPPKMPAHLAPPGEGMA